MVKREEGNEKRGRKTRGLGEEDRMGEGASGREGESINNNSVKRVKNFRKSNFITLILIR